MALLGALSNPVLRRIGVSIIGGSGGVVPPAPTQRYFAKLDAVQQGHYVLQNPVVETGDFEWSFELVIPKLSFHVAADSDAGALSRVAFQRDSAGEFTLWVGSTTNNFWSNVSLPAMTAVAGDGRLHTISVSRTDGWLAISLDGTVMATKFSTGTMRTTTLGQRKGGSTGIGMFSGYYVAANLGNGNKWMLDKDGATVTEVAPNGNVLTRVNVSSDDVELFTLNETTTPNQWENADKSTIMPVGY